MKRLTTVVQVLFALVVVSFVASTVFAQDVTVGQGTPGHFVKYAGTTKAVEATTTEDGGGNVTVRGALTARAIAVVDGGDNKVVTLLDDGSVRTAALKVSGDSTLTRLTVVGAATLAQLSVTSSRKLKYDISGLTESAAQTLLSGLNPVSFKFRGDAAAGTHLGFIAEEVPPAFASSDGETYQPFEIIAVLVKVLQEQQMEIRELQEQIAR